MELLKRQDANASKDIIKLAIELKREFALSAKVVEFSLIVPLEALRSIDYFAVKFNQIKDIEGFKDIRSIENDLFKLKSLEVMTVYKDIKNEDFAKLIYCGISKEYEYNLIRLSRPNNDYLDRILDATVIAANPYAFDSHNRKYNSISFT